MNPSSVTGDSGAVPASSSLPSGDSVTLIETIRRGIISTGFPSPDAIDAALAALAVLELREGKDKIGETPTGVVAEVGEREFWSENENGRDFCVAICRAEDAAVVWSALKAARAFLIERTHEEHRYKGSFIRGWSEDAGYFYSESE